MRRFQAQPDGAPPLGVRALGSPTLADGAPVTRRASAGRHQHPGRRRRRRPRLSRICWRS